MKFRSLLAAALLFVSAGVVTASATPIAAFTGQTITSSSRTQVGRLSRNGVPQSWTHQEAYPTEINGVGSTTPTTYYYTTYTINYANFVPNNYIEVSFTDTAGLNGVFISAYANSYDPTNKALNWLGDPGASEYFSNSDAATFQFSINYQTNVVFVVNTTGANGTGLNNPFDFYVNAYTDTGYDDTDVTGVVTPEPSTFIELGTGLLAMAGVARRRLFAA